MDRPVDRWLEAYSRDHRHPVNERLHYVCVPVIVVSLLALLALLPAPLATFPGWAGLLLAGALVYYAMLSPRLALGMLPLMLLALLLVAGLARLPLPLWTSALLLFAAGWTGQFIGHWYEGARPSFFRDIQFLLIGPLWLLARLYRQLGLRY